MHVVLVHGWSVFDTTTYGQLPERLVAESLAGHIPAITVQNVWLGRYVSFADEVRLDDLATGFEAALQREILPNLPAGERFVCLTHSTGGPIVREWCWRRYRDKGLPCPMSHLIMLAPANFGSPLAQIGKGRLSRLRSWANGISPGQGVLDWLEQGSDSAWSLNADWIRDSEQAAPAADPIAPVFPFVLTGQTIDRQLYDHVNPYTGEMGSDGTVRVPAANLNATYLRLVQHIDEPQARRFDQELLRLGPHPDLDQFGYDKSLKKYDFDKFGSLELESVQKSTATAFRIIPKASHVGSDDGILFSIQADGRKNETIDAIIRCLKVNSQADYEQLTKAFAEETQKVVEKERVEVTPGFIREAYYFRDPHSLVIIRIRDDQGSVLTEYDFKVTGPKNLADDLPPGFLVDRQKNQVNQSTLTFFLNHQVFEGLQEIRRGNKVIRQKTPGLSKIGLRLYAYPTIGYVRFYPAIHAADKQLFQEVLKPHQTTLLDIQLKRIVGRGVFELETLHDHPKESGGTARRSLDFRNQAPGAAVNVP